MIEIYRATTPTDSLLSALHKLLPQLSSSALPPSREYMESLLANKDAYLLVAECDGEIVGMLTLLIVAIPTGRKAWIEDVVTDAACRGRGVGARLVERAEEIARNEGVRRLYLTSNPSRVAAHHLYKRCGFSIYDTALFRKQLE